MKTVTEIAGELADREAIRECLYRYCRGIDRLDAEMLYDVYWPEAIDDHTSFVGTGHEFVDYALPVLGAMDQTMHKLGNILIEIHGDSANTESYFQAFHRLRGEGKTRQDLIVGGRYVDRLEKRDDCWRIADRVVILDWLRSFPDSADWEALPLGMVAKPGGRWPEDRSYGLMRRRDGASVDDSGAA